MTTNEDKKDLVAYNQAMDEHKKNPVVYSQAEVQKMLDTQNAPKSPTSPADPSAGADPLKKQSRPLAGPR